MLLSTLAIIRTIENAQCHIHRIPIELFTGIFNYISHSAFDNVHESALLQTPDSDYHSVQDYMRLQHVCRYWRRSFVDHSSFFTTVVLQSEDIWSNPCGNSYVRTYLSRSGSLPLSVYAGTIRGVEAIGGESRRLQVLQLDYEDQRVSNDNKPDVLESFADPAPLLERLDLFVDHPNNEMPRLPRLFSNETPRLRQLSISGFTYLDQNCFTGLTRLRLTGHKIFGVSGETFRQLLHVLKGQAALQELYLSTLHPWIDAATPLPPLMIANDDVIVLPNSLRRFSLKGCDVKQLKTFFSYLQIARGTSLSVFSTSLSNPDRVFDMFAGSGSVAHFGNMNDLHSLVLDPNSPIFTAIGPSGNVRIRIESRYPRIHVLGTLPFAHNIQELRLRSGTWELDWYSIFVDLSSLRYLCVDHWRSRIILQTLSRSSFPSNPRESRILCKKLQKLAIIGDRDMSYTSSQSTFYDLLLCAESRFRMGHPIQHLQVQPYPEMNQPDIDWLESVRGALQQFVDEVNFNAELQWREIPDHLNEDVNGVYWPAWDL